MAHLKRTGTITKRTFRPKRGRRIRRNPTPGTPRRVGRAASRTVRRRRETKNSLATFLKRRKRGKGARFRRF